VKKVVMSMRVAEAAAYNERRNCIAYDYVETIEARGLHVILVPNNTRLVQKYMQWDDIAIVLLTGGNSIAQPARTSADVELDVYPERDEIELALLELALKQDIPVLGICRGSQFLNIYFGGKITRGIRDHVRTYHNLISPYGFMSGKVVNSFHNDGIAERDLANVLEPLAFSEDGYIEAFRHRTRRVAGILWHPERYSAEIAIDLLDDIMCTVLRMDLAEEQERMAFRNDRE